VDAEPRSGTGSTEPKQLATPWLTHAITLGMAGLVLFLWFEPGPDHPIYGLIVAGWTLNLGLSAVPVALRIPDRWFRVPSGERVVHRMLGVVGFDRLLDWSGWNRLVIPARGAVSRASLPHLYLCMRAAAGAHAIGFAVHMLLAALALSTGHPWGALWILLPGVAVHLYPVLLQRSSMLRLQPLLARRGACLRRC
jgi:hypothetical protein